jgi:DNA repair exonuclease SbcCD nuclease subunit
VVKFVHTADWQIGMRAGQVAPAAAVRIREARFETAERVVARAREVGAQFLIIAGDLFEDNQVAAADVHRVLHILGSAAPLPVFVLPGNHDPLGPDSVYDRTAFRDSTGNVTVIRKATPIVLKEAGSVLLPYPLGQKRSAEDPTSRLPECDDPTLVRIGVTHGSLRIDHKHQLDDFPIDLDVARTRRLDYLALGHWHSFYAHVGRTVYPGAPEPTSFGEPESGSVCLVSIEAPGAIPQVERLPVATLSWLEWDECLSPDSFEVAQSAVRKRVLDLRAPDRTLLRLRVRGRLPAESKQSLDDLFAWASARLVSFSLDRSRLAAEVTLGRIHELAIQHPLLAGVLADLDALRAMAATAGSAPAGGNGSERPHRNGNARPAGPLDEVTLRKVFEQCDGDAEALEEALWTLAEMAAEVWK